MRVYLTQSVLASTSDLPFTPQPLALTAVSSSSEHINLSQSISSPPRMPIPTVVVLSTSTGIGWSIPGYLLWYIHMNLVDDNTEEQVQKNHPSYNLGQGFDII